MKANRITFDRIRKRNANTINKNLIPELSRKLKDWDDRVIKSIYPIEMSGKELLAVLKRYQ